MEFEYIMNVNYEVLEKFEVYYCLYWVLLIFIELLVLFLFLLLRVIMWENFRYNDGRILFLWLES